MVPPKGRLEPPFTFRLFRAAAARESRNMRAAASEPLRASMPVWRNGRRMGLKIPRWEHREGSTPSTGTKPRVRAHLAPFLFYAVPKRYKQASEQFFSALPRGRNLLICKLLAAFRPHTIIRKSLAPRCEQFGGAEPCSYHFGPACLGSRSFTF